MLTNTTLLIDGPYLWQTCVSTDVSHIVSQIAAKVDEIHLVDYELGGFGTASPDLVTQRQAWQKSPNFARVLLAATGPDGPNRRPCPVGPLLAAHLLFLLGSNRRVIVVTGDIDLIPVIRYCSDSITNSAIPDTPVVTVCSFDDAAAVGLSELKGRRFLAVQTLDTDQLGRRTGARAHRPVTECRAMTAHGTLCARPPAFGPLCRQHHNMRVVGGGAVTGGAESDTADSDDDDVPHGGGGRGGRGSKGAADRGVGKAAASAAAAGGRCGRPAKDGSMCKNRTQGGAACWRHAVAGAGAGAGTDVTGGSPRGVGGDAAGEASEAAGASRGGPAAAGRERMAGAQDGRCGRETRGGYPCAKHVTVDGAACVFHRGAAAGAAAPPGGPPAAAPGASAVTAAAAAAGGFSGVDGGRMSEAKAGTCGRETRRGVPCPIRVALGGAACHFHSGHATAAAPAAAEPPAAAPAAAEPVAAAPTAAAGTAPLGGAPRGAAPVEGDNPRLAGAEDGKCGRATRSGAPCRNPAAGGAPCWRHPGGAAAAAAVQPAPVVATAAGPRVAPPAAAGTHAAAPPTGQGTCGRPTQSGSPCRRKTRGGAACYQH